MQWVPDQKVPRMRTHRHLLLESNQLGPIPFCISTNFYKTFRMAIRASQPLPSPHKLLSIPHARSDLYDITERSIFHTLKHVDMGHSWRVA